MLGISAFKGTTLPATRGNLRASELHSKRTVSAQGQEPPRVFATYTKSPAERHCILQGGLLKVSATLTGPTRRKNERQKKQQPQQQKQEEEE